MISLIVAQVVKQISSAHFLTATTKTYVKLTSNIQLHNYIFEKFINGMVTV